MQEKTVLRREMLARRQRLTKAEIETAGVLAGQRLWPLLAGCRMVMLYSPFRGELDTWPVARRLEQAGCGVVLPITDLKQHLLTPARVFGLDSLVKGAYGILEPAQGAFQAVDPAELDAVVVPGVCFDLVGYRIGYGGGYYDRFLPRLAAGCRTIGYGYDWQVVPDALPETWDFKLQYLVTDQRTVVVS